VDQTTSNIRCSSPIRDRTTTAVASSLPKQSDSTIPIAVNQTTSNVRCSSSIRDRTTITVATSLPEQSDSTSPIAENQTISHVRNSSPIRDLTTNKLASSLSERSDSTPASALNQTTSDTRNSSPTSDMKTTSHDPGDRKKLNPVQDNRVNCESKPTAGVSKSTIGFSRNIFSSISMFSLSYSTLPVSSESRSIMSESPFPEHNTKMPPSPFPKGATSVNYPKRNNHHVVTIIAASAKSRATKISPGSPLAPITPVFSDAKASHSHDVQHYDAQRSFSAKDHH
jgi:hypothetical protein